MSAVGLYGRAGVALVRAGVIAPMRPDRALRMLGSVRRLGVGAATAVAAGAARHPDRIAIADDDGVLTWAQLDARGRALASSLPVGPDGRLAIMCRNGRSFVIALVAAARIGCDVVLLNTDFAAPQLAELLPREAIDVAVADPEFAPLFEGAVDVVTDLPARARGDVPTPPRRGNVVILTSGTTGTPKGAQRDASPAAFVGPMTTLLERVGARAGEPMGIAPPLFHGLGLAFLGVALLLGSPVIVRRRFDPAAWAADLEAHEARLFVAVPVMLRRLLETDADLPELRAVVSGGSALAPELGSEFMDRYGDVLFNLYGSTETGWAGVATPADLRAAPGTVGRPPIGATVRILDSGGRPLPAGVTGVIHVGGEMVFDGYTGGGATELSDGLASTGDLGHVDASGRLFVAGRDDDMIVSGGENVFPQEVEETLATHPSVADVAVMGVEDADFGERLAAYVVTRPGAAGDADALREWVRSNLARYKVPRDVVFVSSLPRTATGKVRKRELRAA
jgi:fatty-acyl-CoA synthase